MKCDICKRNPFTREIIADDGLGHLIVLSLCGADDCESRFALDVDYSRFSLDIPVSESVE